MSRTRRPKQPQPPLGTLRDTGHTSVWSDLRRLRRAREGRVIGGVCAGIGPQLRVDPVVLRVIFAVLTPFGGIGALLYLIGWIFMPIGDPAEAEPLAGRPGSGKDRPLRVAAVIVGLVVLASIPFWGVNWDAPALLLLAVLGLVALIRRPERTSAQTRAGEAAEAGGPGQPGQTATGSVVAGQGPMRSYDPAAPSRTPRGPSWREFEPAPPEFWEQEDPLGLAEPTPPEDDPLGLGLGTPGDQTTDQAPTTPAWLPAQPPQPAQPTPDTPAIRDPRARPPKRRSYLFGVTIAALAVATGTLGFVEIGVDLPLSAYVGLALGVVGLALIVGTWFGRSRALIGLGTVLALLLAPIALLEQVPGGLTSRSYNPKSVTDVRPGYEVTAGDLRLDLSRVPFTDTTDLSTSVEVTAGEVRIVVPRGVDVVVDADIGFGDARVLGTSMESGSERIVDHDSDGPGGGRLELAVKVDAGDIQVVRHGS